MRRLARFTNSVPLRTGHRYEMLRLRSAEFILSEAERLSMTAMGAFLSCHAERSEASPTPNASYA